MSSSKDYRFWFYLRKAVFQGLFPITLAFLSFYGFTVLDYYNLYISCSIIILVHTNLRVALQFVFDTCATDVIFRKPLIFDDSASTTILTSRIDPQNHLFVIRKIFQLRYIDSLFIKIVDKLCWALGIDSPVFITRSVIEQVTGTSLITAGNEESLIQNTLTKLPEYRTNVDISSEAYVALHHQARGRDVDDVQSLLF